MIDQEMLRNGSGYPDDTAYKAMTMAPKPGEIWERKVTKDQVLIVAENGNAYSCLRLYDFDGYNKIKVQGRQMMYTNPIMLEYAFPHVLCVYVKTLPDDQFQEVRRAVARVFGFRAEEDAHDEPEAEDESYAFGLKIELEKARGDFEALRKKANMKIEELERKCTLLESSEKDRELQVQKNSAYKEMYENLIDKLIRSKGGAADE